jgi:hypothetical protein
MDPGSSGSVVGNSGHYTTDAVSLDGSDIQKFITKIIKALYWTYPETV